MIETHHLFAPKKTISTFKKPFSTAASPKMYFTTSILTSLLVFTSTTSAAILCKNAPAACAYGQALWIPVSTFKHYFNY